MRKCVRCGHKVQVMKVTQQDSEHKLVEVDQVEARWAPFWCADGRRHEV